jgi:hypothetical protein
MKVKCENCGAPKESIYTYDVCYKCGGTMTGKYKMPTRKVKNVNKLLGLMGER